MSHPSRRHAHSTSIRSRDQPNAADTATEASATRDLAETCSQAATPGLHNEGKHRPPPPSPSPPQLLSRPKQALKKSNRGAKAVAALSSSTRARGRVAAAAAAGGICASGHLSPARGTSPSRTSSTTTSASQQSARRLLHLSSGVATPGSSRNNRKATTPPSVLLSVPIGTDASTNNYHHHPQQQQQQSNNRERTPRPSIDRNPSPSTHIMPREPSREPGEPTVASGMSADDERVRGRGKAKPAKRADRSAPRAAGEGDAPTHSPAEGVMSPLSSKGTTITAAQNSAAPSSSPADAASSAVRPGESPGTVAGSYLNENARLVVSEPQYTSREREHIGRGRGERPTAGSASAASAAGAAGGTGAPLSWLAGCGSPARVRTPPGRLLSPGGHRSRHGSDCVRRGGAGMPPLLVDKASGGGGISPIAARSPRRGLGEDGRVAPLPLPSDMPSGVAAANGAWTATDGDGSPGTASGDGSGSPLQLQQTQEPHSPLRPQHPASSPPLGSYVRHHLNGAAPSRGPIGLMPRGSINGTDVNSEPALASLTPPPAGTLRGARATGASTAGTHGTNRSVGMLTRTPRGPASSPASAVSPSRANAMSNDGRYAGMLSSLSPRLHQQQSTGRGVVRSTTGSGPLSAFDATAAGGGTAATGLIVRPSANAGTPVEPYGNTQLLSSTRESAKRKLSVDVSGTLNGGGGGTRAFALGGSGSGRGTDGAASAFAGGDGEGGMADFGSSLTPRQHLVWGNGRHAAGSGGVKPKAKRNPFSLHGCSGGDARSLTQAMRSQRRGGAGGHGGGTSRQQPLRLSAEDALATLLRGRGEAASEASELDGSPLLHPSTRGATATAAGRMATYSNDGENCGGDSGNPATSPSPVLSISPPPPHDALSHAHEPRQQPTPPYDFRVVLSSGTTSSKPIVLSCGAGCVQGMRASMEDEHFACIHASTVRGQPVSLIGILDGHCGRRVATLGKSYLPHYFFQHSGLGDNNALAMVESILQSDREIFHKLHQPKSKPRESAGRGGRGKGRNAARVAGGIDLFDITHTTGGSSGFDDMFSDASPPGGMAGGGSTLIAAAVHGRMLYVACLGDARAVLLDGRTTIAMSEDHKPQNTKESKRIVRCGGFVQFGRVCGVLAVSRALGDFEFKFSSDVLGSGANGGGGEFPWESPRPANRTNTSSTASGSRFHSGKELMVSNVADVKQLNLTDASQFLVLACDGLWDVLDNDEATQFVIDFLMYTPDINDPLVLSGEKPRPSAAVVKRTLDSCSLKLAEFAVDKGSTDNVSVMILFFHDVVECVVDFSRTGLAGSTGALRASGGGNGGSGRSSGAAVAEVNRLASDQGAGTATVKKIKKRKPAL